MKERHQWMEQERKRQEEENAKIAEFARMQSMREEEALIKKKMLAADKDAIYEKVCQRYIGI